MRRLLGPTAVRSLLGFGELEHLAPTTAYVRAFGEIGRRESELLEVAQALP